MAQKTARKATTTKKVAARKSTSKSRDRTTRKATRGSISKKQLLIGAGIIVLLGLGIGGYALWQNLSAGAAGSMKTIGTKTMVTKGGRSISVTVKACKSSATRVQSQFTVNSGKTGERITPTMDYELNPSGPRQWANGSSIDTRAGQSTRVISNGAVNSGKPVVVNFSGSKTSGFTFSMSGLLNC